MKNLLKSFSLKRFFVGIFSFIAMAFGHFNYHPPAWAQKISKWFNESWLGKKYEDFQKWKLIQPDLYQKRFRLSLAAFVAVAILIGGGVYRWVTSPTPDYVKIRVYKPSPMDPETKIPDILRIHFSKSVAQIRDLGRPVSHLIELNPQMAGVWTWQSDTDLLFTPGKDQGDWAIAQTYQIKFAKELFLEGLKFETRKIDFQTDPLKLSVTKKEFYIDPRSPDTKKVLINFTTNYPVSAEEVRKNTDFTLESKGLSLTKSQIPFTVSQNKYQTEFYLQSEPLSVPEVSQEMIVHIQKGIRAISKGPGTNDYENIAIQVPSKYEALTIQSTNMSFARNAKFEPEQILIIETTSEVRSEDLLQKLKVLLLPQDRPAIDGEEPVKHYAWQSVSELTPDILKKSTEIKLTLVPTENEWSKIHTFKLASDTNRSIYVEIKPNLVGLGGYQTKEIYENITQVPPYAQEIQIMSQGAILTLSGELKLPLLARNVSQVQYTLHRIIPEQMNHLLTNMMGRIAKPDLPYGLESEIAEKFQSTQSLKIESAASTQYFSYDLAPFLAKSQQTKGVFLLKAQAINPDKSYGPSDERLILVTDLGMIVKETSAKNHEVFIQNFRSGAPVSQATVEVVGANGLAILKSETDANGHTSFPDLKDFKDEKRPVAFSVRKGSDVTYLPIRNYSQNLQYSRFDVGGLFEKSGSDQLMSFIFSDRGIYRPGEKINLGVILRSKKNKTTLKDLPLEWVVTNPKGLEILREKINFKNINLNDLSFSTEETSPTGVYDIKLYFIRKHSTQNESELIGSQTVKVEEFQPDRIKIQSHLQFEKLKGWIKPQQMKADIKLLNMFGTAAEKRTVKAELTLIPVTTNFRDFKDYTFSNLNSKDQQNSIENLGEAQTNEKGEASFAVDLTKYQAALFQTILNTEGFESEGGRSVRAMSSVFVSPLEFIIGAKPDGDLLYINKDAHRKIHIIAVNSDLSLIATKDVKIQKIERKYISVLTKADDGSFKYQSVFKETPLEEKDFEVSDKGSSIQIDTTTPGDFALVFKNKNNFELLRVNYTVVGSANLSRSLEKNAELQLSLNKSDFKNGEEIEMQIKAPYKGAGLITIERDGVYTSKWFQTNQTTTVEKIKVPDGLDGNAYVNVTFLRAIDSTEIYMSPLSYAVAPFSISLEEKRTQIKLETPDIIKPGQKLNIKYSANRPTKIILYGVDEGILQVARYKLPDPLAFFFQKRALQVKTFQMLDLLLPEFSLLGKLEAAGGDGSFGAIGKNLNPFQSKRIKPVVFWSGVISADSKTKTYSYTVPETFNGNLKIMAVASDANAIGSNETASLVRGDIILTPSVPVFASPRDEFMVRVGVANQVEGSGAQAKIQLQAQTSSHLQITSASTQELIIDEGRESSIELGFKVLDQLGVAKLTFIANHKKAHSQLSMEMSLRPNTPYLHSIQAGYFGGGTVELKNTLKTYNEFAVQKLLVSTSPFVVATGLISYLDNYPYGCTEQLLTKAIPYLVLKNQAAFFSESQIKSAEVIRKTIQILRTRQVSDGGFALYNPQTEVIAESNASLYAVQFLIEAKTRGFQVPDDLLQRAKRYLSSPRIRSESEDLTHLRKWAYSLYLDARLGTVNGASLAQLRRRLDGLTKISWQSDLTAIYLAGVYSLYKQDELAENLINKMNFETTATNVEYEDPYGPSSRDSVLIEILAKHFPARLAKIMNNESIKKLLEPISQGKYHTNNIGHLLLALDALSAAPQSAEKLASVQAEIMLQKQWQSLVSTKKSPKTWPVAINPEAVKLTSPETSLFYNFSVSGFLKDPTPIKKTIEVGRQYYNDQKQEVSQIALGEELTVHLQVRTLDQKTYSNIAIVDLIPAGFELVAERQQNQLEVSPNSSNQIEKQNNIQENSEDEDPGSDNSESEETEDGDQGQWFSLIPRAYAQVTNLDSMAVNFVDRRDDRLVLYISAGPKLTEFTYRIKAVNKGIFNTPPPFAEGLYNRELQFLGTSTIMKVLERKEK